MWSDFNLQVGVWTFPLEEVAEFNGMDPGELWITLHSVERSEVVALWESLKFPYPLGLSVATKAFQ